MKNTCSSLLVNEACLTVVSQYKKPVNLFTQSAECYECPLVHRIKVHREGNVSIPVDTKHPVLYELRGHDGNVLPNCSYEDHFGEKGSYLLNISYDGTCTREVTQDPVNIHYPLGIAAAVFVLLIIIWRCIRFLRRRHFFLRTLSSYSFESQQVILGPATIGDAASPVQQAPSPVRKRLRSLDTLRGLSIVLMIFVNYGGGKYWFFHHAPWNGLTVADLVFPWFMWIMGTSMAMSVRSLLRKGVTKRRIFRKIMKRSLILFGLGLILNTMGTDGDLRHIRIPGVLQRFGIAYFVTCSVHLLRAKRQDDDRGGDILPYWPEWLVMVPLLALHVCLTFLLHVPGCGSGYLGPGGLARNETFYNCTGGAAGYIDRIILSENHLYQHSEAKKLYHSPLPYDPEGILGCLTSIFLVFLGLQAGKILITYPNWKPRVARWCAWGLLCGIAAGWLCNFSKEDGLIPINKNLWSVSFILAMSGTAYLLLSLLYITIDVEQWWSGAPFFYPGMNPILLYVGHELTHGLFPWFWLCSETHYCYLFMNLWATSLWVIIAFVLYRKGFFLSI
ncbi:heparan-alpha-glucosaminide N-acetyltransferase-like isoform X2 [Ornithodoros turicata]|uniref:heparan-alpha-glucosaminide N-acetyltransferase-like isoform X2 n=1 Tax=Ornithodoros turicata TaxID=34597 RepID=UPI003139CCA7